MKGVKNNRKEIKFFFIDMRIADLTFCTEFQIVVLSRKEMFLSQILEGKFQFFSFLKFLATVKNIYS